MFLLLLSLWHLCLRLHLPDRPGSPPECNLHLLRIHTHGSPLQEKQRQCQGEANGQHIAEWLSGRALGSQL